MSDLVIGNYTAAVTIDGSTHYLLIQPGGSSTAYKKITRNVYLGVSGQPADISTSQNFTNKVLDNTNTITVKDSLFTIQDNLDTTKQAQFQLSGLTTATTRTYTLPNASSTLADIATAQTLTNKTLTAPVINNGSITGTTITTDAIIGQSSATNGTVYGLSITSSKISGASIANATITSTQLANASVTPSKLNLAPQTVTTAVSGTTTSTSFTSTLTGSTAQTVTVTVGANGLLLVGIWGQISNSSSGLSAMSFAFTGANTLAGANTRAVAVTGTSAMWIGSSFLITGLNPGSTVVTMNFAVSANTGTFAAQNLWAISL